MRIGELAATAGTTTKTLRFYEEAKLLPPTERAANGYRDYGPEAVSRLDFIRRRPVPGPDPRGDRHPRRRRRTLPPCAPTAHGATGRHRSADR